MRISGLLLMLSACTATLLPTAECTSNGQCQAAFGFGSVCGADTGLCEATEMDPRCDLVTAMDFEAVGDVEFPIDRDKYFLMSTTFGRIAEQLARVQSVALAVEQVNDEQKLDGKSFIALHCAYDDEQQAQAEVDVAELGAWLALEVGVPVNIGPHASSLCQDMYEAASSEGGMLVISPSATSPALTGVDGSISTAEQPGLFWRTAPPDIKQGAAIAADMRTRFDPEGITAFRRAPSSNVAIVFQTGAYGEGLATIVAEELTARGGASVPLPYSNDGARAQIVADIAANGSYDEVLVISSDAPDYAAFLLGAGGLSWYDDVPIFISDGGRTTDVLTQSASVSHLFPNISGTVPKPPGGVVFESYAAGYRSRYPAQNAADHAFTAQSYDAAWLALYGHAWAVGQEASVGGIQIARGLRNVSSGAMHNIQPTSWNLVASALQEGSSVNVNGASGPLDYDPTLAEIDGLIEIFKVDAAGTNFVGIYDF